MKVNAVSPQLKLLPPAKPSLGLYLRPGRNDHTVFQQLLAEDRAVSGLVLDARLANRHETLRELLVDNGVHGVLDTNMMELASPGGAVLPGLESVPWAKYASASPAELRGSAGRHLAAAIADFATSQDFSAVLAPTHLLASATDEMFAADRVVANELRAALDARGAAHTCVFYPLAIPSRTLHDSAQRKLVISGLGSTAIDAVWLRISPFGTASAGSISLRRYIESAWELQRVGVPLVGERTGTVGLALMAFGAVGGIESGITIGERFDSVALVRPRDPSAVPYSPPPRVYLHQIGAFVSRASARTLFRNRQMIAATGCPDRRCCRDGVSSTLRNPRRHFVLRRFAEVDRIGGAPPDVRASVYLHELLRPAVLTAVRASRILPELEAVERRLEAWNLTLESIATSGPLPAALPALGQRVQLDRPKPQALN